MADREYMREYMREYRQKHTKNPYEQLRVIFRKDAPLNLDLIREYAWTWGESLNGFLKRAVEENIERDKKKNQR